jgi:hypothetical protein
MKACGSILNRRDCGRQHLESVSPAKAMHLGDSVPERPASMAKDDATASSPYAIGQFGSETLEHIRANALRPRLVGDQAATELDERQ